MVAFYLLCVQNLLLNNDGKLELVLLCRGSISGLLLHCSKLEFYHLLKFKARSGPQRIPVFALIPFQNEPPVCVAVPVGRSYNAKCRISRKYCVSAMEE